MKHSQSIKIFAALTAAPRWAIALMPADGAMFPWSSTPWFEIVSGLLSLAFAVVEIWATSFIMQAWHEAQATGDVNLARNLRRLWVTTLVVLAAALVPPMFANVMRVNVNTFNPWLLGAWLTCVAASTFLVIGGVGYADRAQPAAQALSTDKQLAQVQYSGETGTPASVTCDDTCYDASQSRQNAISSDFGAKPYALGAEASSTQQIAVFERDKVTTADIILEYYRSNPDATLTQAAEHVRKAIGGPYSSEAVRQQLKRLEVAGKVSRNGHVEVLP